MNPVPATSPAVPQEAPRGPSKVPPGVTFAASLRGCHTLGMECQAWALVDARNAIHLGEILRWAEAEGKRSFMLGGGSNVLFAESFVDAVVLRLGPGFRAIEVIPERATVRVGAAAHWRTLIKACREQGFGGLEYGWCIPGTIGGALAGNAGAAGRSICEDTVRVTVLGEDGEPEELESGVFEYSYRRSSLAGRTILGAELGLRVEAPDRIDALLEQMRRMRKSQPKAASSGCIFKNPKGESAGRLIESCGLKGMSVGGIQVSEVHANFLINTGGGTPEQMLDLIEVVRAAVKQETGIQLELEVRVIR